MTIKDTINHVALVLDRSISMQRHKSSLVKVADELIAHLAKQSVAMNQETRVTIYTFGDDVTPVVFDKDVLRLPSIKDLYRISGNTALIDASMLSVEDLEMTAQMYGDHAFLVYILTDGQENVSRTRPQTLKGKLSSLPENWTIAALVPDSRGVQYARSVGFEPDNITTWDITAIGGIEQAVERITAATDSYMTSRSMGVRGTKNLFGTGSDVVNKQTISQAGLKPVPASKYALYTIPVDNDIRAFVISQEGRYNQGSAYYQLSKTDTIQPQKQVVIVEKATGAVYAGQHARDLVGLPNTALRVKPDFNPDYDLFVQSTSVNRKLLAGTKLLVLK